MLNAEGEEGRVVNRLLRDIRLLKRMNWPMTVAIGLLMVIGVMFIYSACSFSEEYSVKYLYKRQITWIAAGIICYMLFAIYDYRNLGKLSSLLYGTAVFLLIFVLLYGKQVYGARRWLELPGIMVQPSELAKLAMLIFLARIMSRPGTNLRQIKSVVTILAVAIIPVLLVMKEPDLGTAMIFLPITFIMMFVAGVPLRALGALVIIGLTIVMILLCGVFLPQKLGVDEAGQQKILRFLALNEYQRDRIVVFFQPGRDPFGTGWNKTQSEIAVGSGGVWGKGFKNGTQNILGFLPRSVAPTDFIYSVIAEEKGFSGSFVVLFLFGFIVVSGMQTSLMARDKMGRLLCVGVVTMIFSHVFINIAMTVGLMPITGLPLPLLSYGGSFMIVTMSALGIVQSVYIRSRPPEQILLF